MGQQLCEEPSNAQDDRRHCNLDVSHRIAGWSQPFQRQTLPDLYERPERHKPTSLRSHVAPLPGGASQLGGIAEQLADTGAMGPARAGALLALRRSSCAVMTH